MTTKLDTKEDERAADARLVQRIAQGYGPAPLDEAGRTRFDARLRERLATRGARGPRRLVASLAGAGAAFALLVLAIGRGPLAPAPAPLGTAELSGAAGATAALSRAAVTTAALSAWEWDVMLGDELGTVEAVDEGLPEDYAAIASVFLEE
jgi:hypothetical protein